MELTSYKKPVMRVPYEDHAACSEKMGDWCDCQPANLYGGYQPLGMSAADKQRNLKATVEDIQNRLGCR